MPLKRATKVHHLRGCIFFGGLFTSIVNVVKEPQRGCPEIPHPLHENNTQAPVDPRSITCVRRNTLSSLNPAGNTWRRAPVEVFCMNVFHRCRSRVKCRLSMDRPAHHPVICFEGERLVSACLSAKSLFSIMTDSLGVAVCFQPTVVRLFDLSKCHQVISPSRKPVTVIAKQCL